MAVPQKTGDRTASLQPLAAATQSLLEKAGYKPPNRERERVAMDAATILFGSYRRDDAALPDFFFQAMVAVLAEYPEDCIRVVTDPRTGIQSHAYSVIDQRTGQEKHGPFVAWPPNSGEVQAACERYMAPIRRAAERERRIAEQLAEREAEEAARPSPEEMRLRAEHVRKTLGRARGTSELVAAIDDRAAAIAATIHSRSSALRVAMELEQRREI
jgi:hypothetical protein